MTDDILLNEAWKISERVHENQVYSDGVPYINHVRFVYEKVLKFNGTLEQKIISILHDTVEDGNYSLDKIRKIFGTKIWSGIVAITRKPSIETYEEYIIRLMKNEDAKLVKLCDLLVNLSNCYKQPKQFQPLIERYEKAIIILGTR